MYPEFNIQEEIVLKRIQMIRGTKVMLDSDLALLYQVKRNIDRFPIDITCLPDRQVLQLSEKHWEDLRSQIATANHDKRRNLPYVFTEHGVLMLSSVLSNQKAIQANIPLVRIFTKRRDMLLSQNNILDQIEKLTNRIDHQDEKMDGVVRYLQRFVQEKIQKDNKLVTKSKK